MSKRRRLPADRYGSLPSGHTTPPDPCAPPSLTLRPGAPKSEPPTSDRPPRPTRPQGPLTMREAATRLPCVPRPPPSQPSCSSGPLPPTGRRRVPSRPLAFAHLRSLPASQPLYRYSPRSQDEPACRTGTRSLRTAAARSRPVTPHRPTACAPPSLTLRPRAPKHVPSTSTRTLAWAHDYKGPPTMHEAATRLPWPPRSPPIQPSCSSTPSRPTGRRRVPFVRSHHAARPLARRLPLRSGRALRNTPRRTSVNPPAWAHDYKAHGPFTRPQRACHASRDFRPASPHVHPHLQDPPGGVECPRARSHRTARPFARRCTYQRLQASRRHRTSRWLVSPPVPSTSRPSLTGCP